MDKRGIIITVLAVVFVHIFVLLLVLLPGCSNTSTTNESVAPLFPPLQQPPVEADSSVTANTPPPAEPKQETTVAARRFLEKAKRPGSLTSTGAVSGRILDLKNWNKKSPKNYSRVCGILVDLNSRRVLWQLNPDKQVPIASLTKIMTLLLSYEMLHQPQCNITLDSEIEITPQARKIPPSGVAFRPAEKSFPLRKLMAAAAVKSANDATYLIAQTFGNGSADQFVELMNKRARELGMYQTKFYNPHGLPGKNEGKPDNVSSVRDLVILSEAYLTFPELHQWSSSTTATFRTKNDLISHNNLLKKGRFHTPGVSGIKTGYTNNAGLCLAAVCDRNGRRLLAVVTGFNSAADRDRFTKNLLDWGFRQK